MESKSPPEVTWQYLIQEDNQADMRHRIFNLRQPIVLPVLESILDEIKQQAPAISETIIMPQLNSTVLSVIVSTEDPRSWMLDGYKDPDIGDANDRSAVLFTFVKGAMYRAVRWPPIDLHEGDIPFISSGEDGQ